MISSLITLRLNLRRALSIDSLLLTDIYAIYCSHPLFGWVEAPLEQTIIRHFFGPKRKCARVVMSYLIWGRNLRPTFLECPGSREQILVLGV
jgi:hypothetical protein